MMKSGEFSAGGDGNKQHYLHNSNGSLGEGQNTSDILNNRGGFPPQNYGNPNFMPPQAQPQQ